MEITFEQLPSAIAQLSIKLDNIERLLLTQKTKDKPEVDQILSIKDAAKHLNLAVPTIYAMVGRNEIPFSKKSKRLYFSKQELTDYILSGRQKTASEIREEAVNSMSNNKKGGVR
jgi:excisionase family DNA binding protein